MNLTPASPLTADEASRYWQAFQQGNAAAFEQLFRNFYPGLFAYGRRFTTDRALLEDVLQELFLVLWQQRPDLHHVPAYLYRAFRNRLFRALSQAQQRVSLGDSDEAAGELEEAPDLRWMEDEADQLRHGQLRERLSALSKRQQEVIYLRFFQEQPTEVIADILRIQPQSVRNLLHEALKVLRQSIPGLVCTLVSGGLA